MNAQAQAFYNVEKPQVQSWNEHRHMVAMAAVKITPKRKNFLTAGRWFRAKKLAGPWTAASTDLPKDFKDIPIEHPKSHVLASVPGSPEADAAVLLASIPQKASVDRKTATVTVVYEGDPDFVLIDGTKVYYAVNSPYSVFKVADAYYACHQGVWFICPTPHGPWKVCTKPPDAIYTIPPTHPKYNVTYVYVYDSTPDTVIVGYSSGYTGAYVATTGILMFGLGYAIAHDHYHDHYYHYHPHYYAYGGAARYDDYHGGYYRSAHAYGPYGGAGRSASYNPATGTYSRGAYRYGPGGAPTPGRRTTPTRIDTEPVSAPKHPMDHGAAP